jgi:hypothetical protein
MWTAAGRIGRPPFCPVSPGRAARPDGVSDGSATVRMPRVARGRPHLIVAGRSAGRRQIKAAQGENCGTRDKGALSRANWAGLGTRSPAACVCIYGRPTNIEVLTLNTQLVEMSLGSGLRSMISCRRIALRTATSPANHSLYPGCKCVQREGLCHDFHTLAD